MIAKRSVLIIPTFPKKLLAKCGTLIKHFTHLFGSRRQMRQISLLDLAPISKLMCKNAATGAVLFFIF